MRERRIWPDFLTWRFLVGAGAALGLAITGSICAAVVHDALKGASWHLPEANSLSGISELIAIPWSNNTITGWVCAVLFILLIYALKRMAQSSLTARARMFSERDVKPRKVLIMGLSHLRADQEERLRSDLAAFKGKWALTANDVSAYVMAMKRSADTGETAPFGGAVVEDKGNWRLRENNPWQQNVRAIDAHFSAGSLRRVLILPSNESREQIKLFREFLEALFDGEPPFEIGIVRESNKSSEPFFVWKRSDVHPEGYECRDYEDFDYVHEGLRRATEQIGVEKRRGLSWWSSFGKHEVYGSEDICIDITPGIKIFSIAAAIITLNSDAVFSYVNMAGRTRFYDASVSFPDFTP